jgi:hypothetical protein
MEVGYQMASAARITLLAVEIQAQKYVLVVVKCFPFFRECNISQISEHLYAHFFSQLYRAS